MVLVIFCKGFISVLQVEHPHHSISKHGTPSCNLIIFLLVLTLKP